MDEKEVKGTFTELDGKKTIYSAAFEGSVTTDGECLIVNAQLDKMRHMMLGFGYDTLRFRYYPRKSVVEFFNDYSGYASRQ